MFKQILLIIIILLLTFFIVKQVLLYYYKLIISKSIIKYNLSDNIKNFFDPINSKDASPTPSSATKPSPTPSSATRPSPTPSSATVCRRRPRRRRGRRRRPPYPPKIICNRSRILTATPTDYIMHKSRSLFSWLVILTTHKQKTKLKRTYK
jgi:hypothetical protein